MKTKDHFKIAVKAIIALAKKRQHLTSDLAKINAALALLDQPPVLPRKLSSPSGKTGVALASWLRWNSTKERDGKDGWYAIKARRGNEHLSYKEVDKIRQAEWAGLPVASVASVAPVVPVKLNNPTGYSGGWLNLPIGFTLTSIA